MGDPGGIPVNKSQDHQDEDRYARKGWFQRSLEMWNPFWTMAGGAGAIIVALLTFVLVSHPTPGTASLDRPAVPPSSTSSTASSGPMSAGQIANDAIGDTVTASRHSGATVKSATCYQDSVGQSGGGATTAECDLTYSDGAVFRATVTDDDGNTTFEEEYQENLSPNEIANYSVGDTVTSGIDTGATVVSAICGTPELSSTGWSSASCDLDLSNGSTLDATVEDNGIRNEFQY